MYYTFCCPECGVETDVDTSKLPSLVLNEAQDKKTNRSRSRGRSK